MPDPIPSLPHRLVVRLTEEIHTRLLAEARPIGVLRHEMARILIAEALNTRMVIRARTQALDLAGELQD